MIDNLKKNLSSLFEEKEACREHDCRVDKKGILAIYKPDLGLKDLHIKKELFGQNEPKLCDCVIIKGGERVYLVEIKCGVVNDSELKDIIEQLKNVYSILNKKNIEVSKCLFIYKSLKDTKNGVLKKKLIEARINKKPLIRIPFENSAIIIE